MFPMIRSSSDYSFARLRDFLLRNPSAKILIFDLETNGLYPSDSVLSCTAEKHIVRNGDLELLDSFNRYYFPREAENPSAVRVNGLYREVIGEKRAGRDWPIHFLDDWDFIGFCRDADIVVAHNLEFDIAFCPFLTGKERFCTMKSHAFGKYPKLGELAGRYGFDVSEGKLHAGEYDVFLTAAVFRAILKDLELYVRVENKEDDAPAAEPPGEFRLTGDPERGAAEKMGHIRRRLGLRA